MKTNDSKLIIEKLKIFKKELLATNNTKEETKIAIKINELLKSITIET